MEEGALDVRRECAAMRLRRPAPGRGVRISPSLPPASALFERVSFCATASTGVVSSLSGAPDFGWGPYDRSIQRGLRPLPIRRRAVAELAQRRVLISFGRHVAITTELGSAPALCHGSSGSLYPSCLIFSLTAPQRSYASRSASKSSSHSGRGRSIDDPRSSRVDRCHLFRVDSPRSRAKRTR